MYACGFLYLIMEVCWYVWPFRQPMLAAAGWVISPDCRSPCLMRRQPQSSRTLVVSGHNWPPHVDGKFAYVHAAPSLKKKSWYGRTGLPMQFCTSLFVFPLKQTLAWIYRRCGKIHMAI